MTYKCPSCEYSSIRKYNVERHIAVVHKITELVEPLRISNVSSGHENVSSGHENVSFGHENVSFGRGNVSFGQNENNSINSDLYCSHCGKKFSTKRKAQIHLQKCAEKELTYQCQHCHQKFASRVTLFRHKKNCEATTPVTASSSTTIMNQHIQNVTNIQTNIQNNNHVHIHINYFGQESKDHITPQFALECFERDGGIGLLHMIQKIYFDPAHPENHNAIMHSVRDSIVKIFSDNHWIPQSFHTVFEEMMSAAAREIQKYITLRTLDSYSDDQLCVLQNRMTALQGNIDVTIKKRITEKTKSKLLEQKVRIEHRLGKKIQ